MPTSVTAIVVIVAFLMPGFISNRFLAFAYPNAEPSDTRIILSAVAFSCLNYALLSWLLILFWLNRWYENFGRLAALAFFVLFVAPVLLAWLFVEIVESGWGRAWRNKLGLAHPLPKAWDYFFSRGRPCWVVATLKTGRTIAGYYGNNSFASSFPAEEDLYLEKLCTLTPEGLIVDIHPQSAGGIIKFDVIETLEFFDGEPAAPKKKETVDG